MIHSAYKLMSYLKKMVNTDKDEIWIDYENSQFSRTHDATEPSIYYPFPLNEPSVSGLLKYLHDEGYIILEDNGEYCTLTYKALYYDQTIRQERLHYVLNSIFVPIVLSVITSILTTTFLPELLSALLQRLQ